MTTCPVVIGRERELAALRSLVEAARNGEGRVALIGGEAGLGKSRLVAELRRFAAEQDFQIAQGECFEADRAYPYAPVLDLLRAHFVRDPAALMADREPLTGELVALLPDLAPLLPPVARATSVPALDPDQRKHRLFSALTRFLAERAARQPLLVVVEDVHWCDESSLELLLHLARRCAGRALLFAFTYRSEEVAPGLRHWLAGLDRERLAREFALAPLSRAEVEAMLRAILAAPTIGAGGLAETVHALAEGNPFFVEEVLASLLASGELRLVDGAWTWRPDGREPGAGAPIPRSVQDAVQQRVARLSVEARRALTLAAIAGRRFDFALLARSLGRDEAVLLPLVKELVAVRLIDEESADRFVFRHALVQRAVLGEMLARERRASHRAVADALETLHETPAAREAHLADLAHHCHAAGDWARAEAYSRRAGERALALHAPGAAVDYLTRALEAAERLHGAPPADLLHARGQAYALRDEFDRAREDYERALAHAEATADGALAWRCTMALGQLWAGRDYAQVGAWFRRAGELAARLGDPTLQARGLNRLGNWLSNTGQIEAGLRAHHEALAIFEERDDARGMAESFDLLGTTCGMRGDKIAAVGYLGRAIPLFRALGDAQGLTSTLAMHAMQSLPWSSETALSPLRPHADAARDAREALQLARQIESPAAQAYAAHALANALLARGEFGPCLVSAREAQRIAIEVGHRQWMVAAAFVLGRTYVLLRAPAQAVPTAEAALSLARELGSTYWVVTCAATLARAHLLGGDLPAARAVLQAALARDQRPRSMPERGVALAWGELALAQGEAGVALEIAEHLLESATDAAPGVAAQPIPLPLQLRGEALLALARPGEAVMALEEARRGALERGSRPDLWGIHGALGRAYRDLRRDDDARREFEAARQLIEDLAETVDDDALRDQYRRAARAALPHERPISRREAARRDFGGLTAREREVAALVAQGQTSREIAALLAVTERTAEAHVGNILGKLGFSSRAQVAAWATERGLRKVDAD